MSLNRSVHITSQNGNKIKKKKSRSLKWTILLVFLRVEVQSVKGIKNYKCIWGIFINPNFLPFQMLSVLFFSVVLSSKLFWFVTLPWSVALMWDVAQKIWKLCSVQKKPLMSHKAVMNPASVLITGIFIIMDVIKHHKKEKVQFKS